MQYFFPSINCCIQRCVLHFYICYDKLSKAASSKNRLLKTNVSLCIVGEGIGRVVIYKIEGALNMPLGQLVRMARYSDLKDLKGKKICTDCSDGYRGNMAADELSKQASKDLTP
jgi:hypothetical protein